MRSVTRAHQGYYSGSAPWADPQTMSKSRKYRGYEDANSKHEGSAEADAESNAAGHNSDEEKSWNKAEQHQQSSTLSHKCPFETPNRRFDAERRSAPDLITP
jgi:hypothetical protein